MTTGVLNLARPILTERESIIREAIARMTAAASSSVASSMAPFIYVPLLLADSLQVYINSLTNGGTIILDAGQYYLKAGLTIGNANVTIMGMGMYATTIKYILDANTDIITVTKGSTTIRDLRIAGSDNYVNGGGAIGTGRGVVFAPTTTCVEPTLRNVEIANTGSWCIWSRELFEPTDLGTGVSPNKDWGYPLIDTSLHGAGGGTVCLTLDNVFCSFPNSGGCLFLGYGCAAPRISGLKTNSYSFGTYAGPGAVAESIGAVHLLGVTDAIFDNKCVFQSPSAQSGGPSVAHNDTDATMISFHLSSAQLDAPYFEVLSSGCLGTGTGSPEAAGRNRWIVTANNSDVVFASPYVLSGVSLNSAHATGYPLRIMHTPLDDTGTSIVWRDGNFSHFRETYAVGTAPLPKETGDPSVWDRDDFVFGGFSDGEKEHPVIIENCNVANLTTGKSRDPSTPASAATGYSVPGRQAVSFSNAMGPLQLARLDDCNPAGPGTPDDLRSRWQLNHETYGGILGYVRGTGFYAISTTKHSNTALTSAALFGNVAVGNSVSGTGIPANTYVTVVTDASNITINNAATDSLTSTLNFTINGTIQREGLALSSHRGSDFRQIPYMRVHPTNYPVLYAGDLWMKLSGTVVSSVYPTAAFAWYDGTQWQYVPTGNAAGDLAYWTAAGVPTQLTIGASGKFLKSTGAAPSWASLVVGDIATPEFSDSLWRVVDNGDATKKLAVEASAITTGTTRTWDILNAPGAVPMSGSGANPPASGAIGRVNLTGQVADIASTKLTDTTPAGLYVIHAVLEDTTADVAAGTVTVTFAWTDDVGATTDATLTQSLILVGRSRVTIPLYLASGNITYSVAHTGIFGTSAYALRIRCLYLG